MEFRSKTGRIQFKFAQAATKVGSDQYTFPYPRSRGGSRAAMPCFTARPTVRRGLHGTAPKFAVFSALPCRSDTKSRVLPTARRERRGGRSISTRKACGISWHIHEGSSRRMRQLTHVGDLDNCRNPKKCQCQQLTKAEASRPPQPVRLGNAAYDFRTLPKHVPTGIYECNSGCKCMREFGASGQPMCNNRVAQHKMDIPLEASQ